MKFAQKLEKIVNENDSLLCVGLDIDKDKIKSNSLLDFNKKIIDQTKDLVCAYKINMAFYEVYGRKGWELLENTIRYIPNEIITILDGKRNDIGNTAKKYAKSAFEELNVDSVTINPYLGIDGIRPFLNYSDKCSFILCRTSNASAIEIQDLKTPHGTVYEIVAQHIKAWKNFGYCGAVVGATYPDELKVIRSFLGEDVPILIPGIGAQGGDVEKTVEFGTNSKGKMAIISSSRGIIFSKNPRDAALKLKDKINDCL